MRLQDTKKYRPIRFILDMSEEDRIKYFKDRKVYLPKSVLRSLNCLESNKTQKEFAAEYGVSPRCIHQGLELLLSKIHEARESN